MAVDTGGVYLEVCVATKASARIKNLERLAGKSLFKRNIDPVRLYIKFLWKMVSYSELRHEKWLVTLACVQKTNWKIDRSTSFHGKD